MHNLNKKHLILNLILAGFILLSGLTFLTPTPVLAEDPPRCIYRDPGVGDASEVDCEETAPGHTYNPDTCYEIVGPGPTYSVNELPFCDPAIFPPSSTSPTPTPPPGGGGSGKICGAPDQNPVTLGVSIGCRGQGNPIFDMIGAIVRFLSIGVGLVIVLMIIIAGIRYITSSGDAEAVQGAKKMLTNAVIALLLFIFAAAILNFLVPGGLLNNGAPATPPAGGP